MDRPVLDYFLSLCAIPHPSHHEEAISRYLYQWGLDHGLAARRDAAGNVILDKSAAPGCESAPRVILQAHMDMVMVADEGVAHDRLRDPVPVYRDGDTLKARGTSLGGDDGAGVAVAMAVLADGSAVHGPLRAIFTVDEEDGMGGADALTAEDLDADFLINLDWEGFGSLCCSSAGSDMYAFSRPAEWEIPGDGFAAFALSVQGLEGGHSGALIHLGRANAIRLAAGVLKAGLDAGCDVRLAALRGGSAHNAIPSAAQAAAVVPRAQAEAFLAAAREASDALLERCALTDPNAVVSLRETEVPARSLSAAFTRDALGLLLAVHDGVNTMSPSIPGLVESSANTGLASLDEKELRFLIHQRSSEPSVTEEMKAVFAAQAKENGFAMECLTSSPAWPVRPDSALVELCRREFRSLFGSEIRVEPVHAGLECGAFAQRNPALDIISIGPDIQDIHSPRETLSIPSVYQCEDLVRRLLRELARA